MCVCVRESVSVCMCGETILRFFVVRASTESRSASSETILSNGAVIGRSLEISPPLMETFWRHG